MGKFKFYLFMLFTFLLVILSITGGWDRYEISNHTLVTLIGIDKKDNALRLFLEYQPPHGQSSLTSTTNQKKSKTLFGEGKTFAEAENSYLRKVPDDTYLGTIRAIVMSDEFAQNGIEEYLNRITGKKEYRKIPNVFTTNAKIEDLFDSEMLETQNIGFDIEHLAGHLNEKGIDFSSTIPIILENINTKNTGFITNHLDIIDNQITNVGYSVFNEDKKIGFITQDKIKGINYLLVKKAQGTFTLEFEDVTATVEVYIKSKNIKANYENGNITFDIKMSFDSHLINTSTMIRLDNDKMKLIAKKEEEIIKQDLIDSIEKSQKEFQCDYLSFYKYFRAKYNSDFEKMNWNDKYKEAKFNINVKVKISPSNLINFDFK